MRIKDTNSRYIDKIDALQSKASKSFSYSRHLANLADRNPDAPLSTTMKQRDETETPMDKIRQLADYNTAKLRQFRQIAKMDNPFLPSGSVIVSGKRDHWNRVIGNEAQEPSTGTHQEASSSEGEISQEEKTNIQGKVSISLTLPGTYHTKSLYNYLKRAGIDTAEKANIGLEYLRPLPCKTRNYGYTRYENVTQAIIQIRDECSN